MYQPSSLAHEERVRLINSQIVHLMRLEGALWNAVADANLEMQKMDFRIRTWRAAPR
jgi:hypothetical protein